MDVNELMTFKPTTAPKRPLASASDGSADDFHGGPASRVEEEEDPDLAASSYERRAAKRRRQRQREEERLAQLEAEAAAAAAASAAARRSKGPTEESGLDGPSKLSREQREEVEAALARGDRAGDATMDETALK